MFNWFKSLFKDKGYYPVNCFGDEHFGKVKTPTLSRIVISIDAPCQCGFYKSHKHFMDEQFKHLREALNGPQE